MIDLVPILDIKTFWPIAKPHIEAVINRVDDETDIDEIYDELIAQKRQLWMVFKKGEVVASVLTRITICNGKRVGYLTHAGGQGANEWFDIVNPIGEFFKAEECEKFRIFGRKGWKKYLPDWRNDLIMFERKL